MLKATYSLLISLVLFSCGQKGEHVHGDGVPDSTNLILYNQVMDIHDEIMPKMEDLYNLKKDLSEQLAALPASAGAKKDSLEKEVQQIDSVSRLMMDWMHEFNPLPDSSDSEQSRAYLESEMEKIRKVKEAMLETLGEGSN